MRALLDACVLYPWTLRDFLIRVAQTGAFTPLWSDEILDEFVGRVLRDRKDLPAARLKRTRSLMEAAFPTARVQVDANLIAALKLPDPDDRHVLAAGIAGNADLLVTFNLRDFPGELVRAHGIVVLHPDTFAVRLLDVDAGNVLQALTRQVAALRTPPMATSDLLDVLARSGLSDTVRRLRTLGEAAP